MQLKNFLTLVFLLVFILRPKFSYNKLTIAKFSSIIDPQRTFGKNNFLTLNKISFCEGHLQSFLLPFETSRLTISFLSLNFLLIKF